MSDSHTTVALLSVALVFGPAALLLAQPAGSLSLTLACSVVCAALAGLHGAKYSRLTIPCESEMIPPGSGGIRV